MIVGLLSTSNAMDFIAIRRPEAVSLDGRFWLPRLCGLNLCQGVNRRGEPPAELRPAKDRWLRDRERAGRRRGRRPISI